MSKEMILTKQGVEIPNNLLVGNTGTFTKIQVLDEYELPLTDGTSGQALITDGTGNVYWGNVSTDLTGVLTSAILTTLVPYSGAINNVDLGSYSLIASNISGTNTGDQDLSSYLTSSALNEYITDATSDGTIYGRKDGEWVNVAGVDTDELVKFNALDSTAGYLEDKTFAGTGIILVENADRLQITNSDLGSTAVTNHENTYNHSLITSALQPGDNISNLVNDVSYITGYLETDPVFISSPAFSISETDITNLSNLSGTNTGDQDLSSYVLTSEVILKNGTTPFTPTLTYDPVTKKYVDDLVISAGSGDVIGPDSAIDGNIVLFDGTSGLLIKDSGYDLSNYLTSSALIGYLTSESDPIFTASEAYNITATDITNLGNLSGVNTGDQDLSSYLTSADLVGYLTSEALNDYVPNSRIISINGDAYDLSQDRVWTIDEVTPGGSLKSLQYNDSNAFNGAANTKWNKITARLGLGMISTQEPDQLLDIQGKIRIADDGVSPSAGTIRFDGSNFQGYDGSNWQSLDVQAASGGGWTEDTTSDLIRTTTLSRNVGIGIIDPQQKLDVEGTTIIRDKLKVGTNIEGTPDYEPTQTLEVVGSIKIGNDGETPSVGTIKYDSGSFQGYTSVGWVPLDVQSFSGGGWTVEEESAVIFATNVTHNVTIGGVDNEGYKLYVDGTTRFIGNSFITGKTYITASGPTSIPAGAQQLQVNGKIGIGNDGTTPTEGTIRYYLGAFEGYTATGWKPLDASPTSSAGGWTDDGTYVTLTSPSRLVGIGTATPTEELEVNGSIRSDRIGIGKAPTFLLDVNGAIRIGASPSIPAEAGVMRWDGSNFQGYNGSYWVNLDSESGAGGSGGWTESEEDNKIYPTTFATRNVAIGHYEPTEKLHVVGNILSSNKIGAGSISTSTRRLHLDGGSVAGMTITPSSLPGSPIAGDIFIDSDGTNDLKWYNGSDWISASPVAEFKSLTDTPDSYASQGTRVLAVKADETGIEFISGGTVGTDTKVKATIDDTTEGYLLDKLVAGEKITLTTNNPGGNETVTVAVDLGDLNATYAKLDGTNHPFDKINIDNQLYLDVSDTDNSEITNNAYVSSGIWYLKNTLKPAVRTKYLSDESDNAVFTVLTAPKGVSPISTWTQQFFVNELGEVQIAGNVMASNLSGTNTGDQDLSDYVVGPASATDNHLVQFDGITGKLIKGGLSVTTSIGSPGSDTNIPTEQAVREVITAGGFGNVSGPESSQDNEIVIFEGTSGLLIKNSNTFLSELATVAELSDYAKLTGAVFTGTISATNLSGTNTGDQTITLTGNVTGSGTGSFVTTIANNAITTAKILDDNVTLDKLVNATTSNALLGRYTPGTGNFEEIKIGTNLSISEGFLNAEGGAGTATWGGISGTLSDQTDLQSRLDAVKKDAITFTYTGTSTGLKQRGVVPYDCEIVGYNLVSALTGGVVIDIWKGSGIKPTSSSLSICASAKPTLTNNDLTSDIVLSGWTTNISAGDVLAFNIDSIEGVDQVTLVLEIEK